MANSVSWRKEGNDMYKKAMTKSDKPVVGLDRRDLLNSAITAYNKAMAQARDLDELSSAAKNFGQAAWKMACCVWKLESPTVTVEFHFKESVKYFSKAVMVGPAVKPVAWTEHLLTSYNSCVQDYILYVESRGAMDRVIAIEAIVHLMQDDNFKADCYLVMANVWFHHGSRAVQQGDFRTALHALDESNRPMEEARRLSRDREYILTEVRVLEDDVFMQRCSAESLQATTIGDELLVAVLKNEEFLDMSGVYEVMDWYKKAILLTREIEVEMEAIAHSRLGKVYDQVLKQKSRAKENYVRAIQLAHSMAPRKFTSQGWYKMCTDRVDAFQQEIIKQTDEKEQKNREQYLKELKDEIEALDNVADNDKKSGAELLFYVYNTHPPKNPAHRLTHTKEQLGGNSSSTEIQKLLLKALAHYHPDKQDKAEHGELWFVLSGEISKRLSAKYQHLKMPLD